MKFKSVKRRSLRGRKVKSTGVFKTWPSKEGDFRKLRKPRLQLEADHQCCSGWIRDLPKKQKFLVMGKKVDNSLVPTFIVPWSRDKVSFILYMSFSRYMLYSTIKVKESLGMILNASDIKEISK